MTRVMIAGVAFALVVAATAPAAAHRLKLFAAVAAGEVSGYGFFIGGARPAGATLTAVGPDGAELFHGATGADGSFAFRHDGAGPLTLTLTVGDGHRATLTLPADRFAAAAGAAPATPSAPSATTAPPTGLQAMIERSVEVAVARQIRPLLEAHAAAEARLRFNDLVGGIGMIIGFAGIALWARRRRR